MYTFRLVIHVALPLALFPLALFPLADSPLLPFLSSLYLLGTLLAVTGSVYPGPWLLVN